ncbi:alanyl-tRNA editing protein Aarsd1-B [Anoplophora glabripennis]|nr:alanyl-tRNA editing protein Aarsd1-B [Anoplophora glabripennis]
MVFKCQENSFLKEFTSKVVSCKEVELNTVINGKKEDIKGYELILEDTILFPEGGGQPCDHGYLNEVPVKLVVRKEDIAIHYVDKPFNIGDDVKQNVDWERRFDHMQQHSGQHLITAIIEKEFGFATASWWLGEEISHVELDTPSITPEQIKNAERIANELIRDGKNVTVKVYTKDTPEEQLKEARSTRGLPADHKGDIRVINIEDVESTMCCGTHVKNLSQLQVIKLLHAEKSKRKDKIFLYFLVGNRVINRLETCIDREQKMTVLLKNNPSEHTDLVDKLLKNVKTLSKNLQTVLKDVAVTEAKNLKILDPPPKYFFLHRKEAEPDFMNVLIKELGRTDIFLFLSTGDEKTVGNIVLYGEEKYVSDLGNQICEMFKGKGAGKGNKFQAKVTKMVNRKKAEQYISDYFKDK